MPEAPPGLDGIAQAARAQGLWLAGALHPAPDDVPGAGTLVLLAPAGAGFWPVFTAAPEYADARPDPLDRWSARVIGALAQPLGARALFPFGGPPYHPFLRWARESGRAHTSPVGLLVHDAAGLMISYRGALALPGRLELPPAPAAPCDSCADQPCRSACPVAALGPSGYDVPGCKTDLDRAGNDCMAQGCAVRRACPVSAGAGRSPAQSAFHMRAFR